MASGGFHHIVGGSLSFGHAPAGNIGYIEKFGSNSLFGAGKFFGYSLLLFLEHGHGSLGCLCVLAAAFLHGAAYAVGHTLELGGGIIVFKLQATTYIVESEHAVDGLLAVETFHGQTLYDKSRVGLYLL
ncbi:hypothetical protein IMSAGC008_02170 [Muribaculaceae bacterium]|nr:hypothetical protein IMSAGC008_02170 [Muribaculaceae bacterium]